MKVFLLFFLFLNISFAAEYNAKIIINDPKIETWTEGQYFNGLLEIWPVNDSKFFLNSLKGQALGGKIHIMNLSSIERSENNWEVVTARFTGVIVGALSRGEKLQGKVGGNNISITWNNASLSKFEGKKDKLIVANQLAGNLSFWQKLLFYISELSKFIWLVFLFSMALIFILVPPYFFKLYRSKKREKERIKIYMMWKEQIISAKERQELERIYLHRREWMSAMNFTERDCKDFFLEINKFQYKPEWTAQEHERVLSALNYVIRDFDGV